MKNDLLVIVDACVFMISCVRIHCHDYVLNRISVMSFMWWWGRQSRRLVVFSMSQHKDNDTEISHCGQR